MLNIELEHIYLNTKRTLDNLRRHMKKERDKLNETAEMLLNNQEEYIFTSGDLVIKKPTSHTITKIKK